ncbi:MAG: hypothetical protein HC887_00940 [Desulfobacteraceae bacterium]|nr:hypothetical protein [Desulfobacteraceae bacterium]
MKRADEEVAIAIKKVSEFEGNEKKASEELQYLKDEIAGFVQDIERIREKLDSKSKSLGNQVKTVQTLEMDKSKLKSKFGALKKMEDSFEGHKEGVRAVMRRSKQDGILGLVADILVPQTGYETAVEAVLGELLQYIIVRDRDTGFDAIDFLKTQAKGRSGFIAASSVRKIQTAADIRATTGGCPYLMNFVSVKTGFENVADAMLGNVLVAETREQALTALNGNSNLSVVTKDGEVITAQGILIGGSPDSLSGILSKKQELRELEATIVKLETALEHARHEQKELETEARELESDLQKLKSDKNEAVQEEIEKQKAAYKASEELKHARRHLEMMKIEQEQLLGEDSDMEAQNEKYRKLLAEVENEVRTAQDHVAAMSDKISQVSAQIENANQRSLELQLKLTSLTAKRDNSISSLKRLKDFQTDSLQRLEQLSRDIVQKEQKRSESVIKVREYDAQLTELYHQIRAIDENLEKDESEYQSIDNSLKEKDAAISDIQKAREETLQKIRVLEIEQSQKELKRDNVTARISERYHKPLADFTEEFTEEDRKIPADKLEADIGDYRKRTERIGEVNLAAIAEYEALKTRFEFLEAQRNDLVKAIDDLHKVIRKLNKISQEKFLETFALVNQKLAEVFPRLFNGGTAQLVLTEPEKPLETGVELMIHPPGKKLTRLSLLSGGEKALSAIAFIFSIFLIRPTSFCIMDEIDAPLDEANVLRFNELLKIIGEKRRSL